MHHLGRFRGNVETAYSALQDHLEPVGPSNRSLLSRFGGGERLNRPGSIGDRFT